jgi:hypothetical protein
MPDVAAIHAASIASLEAYYGSACPTVTWNGATYPSLGGTAAGTSTLGIGGFGLESDLVRLVRYSLFGAGPFPAKGQTIVYNPSGKTYRIEKIELPEGSPFLRLTLADITKGS